MKTTERLWTNENKELIYQWEIDRNDIQITSDPIGSGGWGTIHKGKWRGIDVAVKKLHHHVMSRHNEEIVRREIRLLSQARHPNILLFLGAVIKGERESSFIVTELLHTDLRSAYGRDEIIENTKLPILSDIAAALIYLHSCRIPIIHRDVSSANVLLEKIGSEQKWKAKLSDFGSANVLAKSETPHPGAAIYAAPETWNSGQQTDKMDVYSFGVLLCEVKLCLPPPDEQKNFFNYMSKIMFDDGFYQLAKMCTKQSPQDRPSMAKVLASLYSLKQ